MQEVYLKRGSFYSKTEGNFEVMPYLDEGIYQMHQNPMSGEIYLQKISDKFEFGFKLYGLDEKLIKHVVDTYNKQEHKKNIGVLLNGAKGTGKTVTAKTLCNKLGLPVIIVDGPMSGLSNFLAGINHDCVFLFDEFEKNFSRINNNDEECAGEELLSIMDGIYNGNFCHIFILTTNELRVNDNLISRPSRIRYLKSFGEVIDKNILIEYIDDNLKNKAHRDELIEFIDTLTIATIDIVKSLVDEINVHDCSIDEFKGFFNVKEAVYKYYVRTWRYDIDSNENTTKTDFLKHASTYSYTNDDDKNYIRPCFGTLELNKNISKYNVGDYINDRFMIEEIDIENCYMLVSDVRYRNSRVMYYFENIDATPSIYADKNRREAYGYYDYD